MGEINFGPLQSLLERDEVTDIDYNGSSLWATTASGGRINVDMELSNDFLESFTMACANLVSKPFNKMNPILEAESKDYRITIVHESVAISGRCICIRKSKGQLRYTKQYLLDTGYASEETLDLLIRFVQEHKNIVFAGEPGVGKTEAAKFFASFIPEDERVITIEDNPEWHFSTIHPDGDCVELRLSPQMDYCDAIKVCLRMNPKWMMLSEARSREVVYLLEGFSTGVKGFTTLHTDDVRKIPDRIVNMAQGHGDMNRLENDVYSFIDVGVLIKKRHEKNEDGTVNVVRYIDQIALFDRVNGKNQVTLLLDQKEEKGYEN